MAQSWERTASLLLFLGYKLLVSNLCALDWKRCSLRHATMQRCRGVAGGGVLVLVFGIS